jgi:hypothetical protein
LQQNRRLAQGQNFSMGGGIMITYGIIMGSGKDSRVLIHQDRAHRNFSKLPSLAGFLKRHMHE